MTIFSTLYNNPNAGWDLVFKTLSTRFAKKFDTTPINWDLIATRENIPALEVDYGWLGDMPTLRKWDGERQFKEVKTYSYKILAETYESTLKVKIDDLKFGKIDKYGLQVDVMAAEARNAINRMVWKKLLTGFTDVGFDGVPFFADNHPIEGGGTGDNNGGGNGDPWFLLYTGDASLKPIIYNEAEGMSVTVVDDPASYNVFLRKEIWMGTEIKFGLGYGRWQYAFGSKQTLDQDALFDGIKKMQLFKDANGNPYGRRPDLLIAHPNLESKVLTLVEAGYVGGGNTNITQGAMRYHIEPNLAQ